MKVLRNILFLCLAVLLLYAGFSFLKRKKSKPNIMVILIDTLRADHLGYNGYERDTSPNIDKLAKENFIYRKAMSSSAWTPPSTASIFTGLYASVHGHMPLKSEDQFKKTNEIEKLSKLDDSYITWAEVFKQNGYATAAVSANPLVSPKYGYAQGFDRYIAPPGRETGDKINRRAIKLVEMLQEEDKPFFLYVHYMDPHMPYKPPAEYAEMFKGSVKNGRQYPEKETNMINRYDGEIKFVDYQIGELFKNLKEKGLYEDMAILLVADHGEQFLERNYWGHADRVHAEEVQIPLILKAKGMQGEEKTVVSNVDIFPTLMEVAGIKFGHQVNGYSLISQLEERKKKGIISEVVRHWNEKAYFTPEGKKLLTEYPIAQGLYLDKDSKKIIAEKLYDIHKDPTEMSPIANPEETSQLRDEYFYLYDEIMQLKKHYKVGSMEADPETLNQLKTLGYM